MKWKWLQKMDNQYWIQNEFKMKKWYELKFNLVCPSPTIGKVFNYSWIILCFQIFLIILKNLSTLIINHLYYMINLEMGRIVVSSSIDNYNHSWK